MAALAFLHISFADSHAAALDRPLIEASQIDDGHCDNNHESRDPTETSCHNTLHICCPTMTGSYTPKEGTLVIPVRMVKRKMNIPFLYVSVSSQPSTPPPKA